MTEAGLAPQSHAGPPQALNTPSTAQTGLDGCKWIPRNHAETSNGRLQEPNWMMYKALKMHTKPCRKTTISGTSEQSCEPKPSKRFLSGSHVTQMTHSGELSAPHHPLPSSDHSAEKHLLGSPQGGLGPPTVFRKGENGLKKKTAFQFYEGKSTLQRPAISTVLGFTWGGRGGREEKKNHLAGPEREDPVYY